MDSFLAVSSCRQPEQTAYGGRPCTAGWSGAAFCIAERVALLCFGLPTMLASL